MRKKQEKGAKKFQLSTVQMIALGFFAVIMLGGFLLWLPISNQQPIAFLDALFTSVTAVCVTGLITIVPATQFTLCGKVILLLLIQIGGLGVVACSVAFFLLLHKRITVKERVIILEAYGLDELSGMVKFIIGVLKGTFFVEGIGAFFFACYFVPRYGLVRGIWYGIFHSISAFCNAGIDILGDSSFIPLNGVPIINFTTMGLIILSGLGFTVWYDVVEKGKAYWKKRGHGVHFWRSLVLQSKVVLTMTACLLFIGFLVTFLVEYNNPETMAGLSLGEKLMAAAFQSVTTRTAGFASVSQSGLHPVTKLLCCMLMFIGGSPGGTAGGVKTATVALVLMTAICVLKGKRSTECFHRKLAPELVRSALTILLVSFTFWIAGVMSMMLLEPNVACLDIMYEVSSALATVGLTADLTPHLSRASQGILMVLMYVGRIGPITMAMIFLKKSNKAENFRELPEKTIMIG